MAIAEVRARIMVVVFYIEGLFDGIALPFHTGTERLLKIIHVFLLRQGSGHIVCLLLLLFPGFPGPSAPDSA
jgi:hypothetical protein